MADETAANQPQPRVQLCHRRGKSMNAKPQAAIIPLSVPNDLTLDALHLISAPMNKALARANFTECRRGEAWRRRARPRAHA